MKLVLFIFAGILTMSSYAQKTLKLKMPQPGDATYYANVPWDEKEIFTSFDYIQWEYKKFRPQIIKKERFTDVKNSYSFSRQPSVAWNKGVGDIFYYVEENNEVVLAGVSEKSDFSKSQVIHYDIIGNAVQYPLNVKMGDRISNLYDKVATLSKEELTGFIGLPDNCDSVKLIITVEEEFTFMQINNLEMHHFSSPGILKEGEDRSSFSMQMKFEGNSTWYPYTYTRKNLPFSLMPRVVPIISTKYVYYTEDYVFPVLQYSKTNRKIHDIQLQDKSNIFDAMSIDVVGRSMFTTPNPTYGVTTFTLINSPVGSQRLEIFNITGKRVRMFNFSSDKSNVFKADLSSLPKGIYLYRFVDYLGRRSSTHRFIKASV